MATRAEAAGMSFIRQLAIVVLASSPFLANAQGYTAQPQALMRTAPAAVAEVATAPLTNLTARKRRSLNGTWQALVDPYADGIGQWKAVWKDRTASGNTEFIGNLLC